MIQLFGSLFCVLKLKWEVGFTLDLVYTKLLSVFEVSKLIQFQFCEKFNILGF